MSHSLRAFLLCCIPILLALPTRISAQAGLPPGPQKASQSQAAPTPQSAPAAPSAAQAATPPQAPPASPAPARKKQSPDPEAELQRAVASAGNDRVALVRNLKSYLEKFPDAPRRGDVYRALVESCQQLADRDCALEYSERLVALQPDDTEMMMIAVSLLQDKGDDSSLTRAVGYVGRVLDRIEKTSPDDRPARTSLEDWRAQQDDIRSALYYLRGNIERLQRNFDSAAKDLQTSYAVVPNALAAKRLGELAERRNDLAKAIEEYTLAFVLPESGPAGKIDRREIRMALGNDWRQVHGSETGLGASILAAYDGLGTPAQKTPAADRNKDAKDTFAFVLRRVKDGAPLPLATLKGKVIVLSFWATWCGPCQEVEPLVDALAHQYAGNDEIYFLAVNTDEDQPQVAPFLAQQKWSLPAAFADGLDDFMNVTSLPTLVVMDRSGKIVYRENGIDPDTFPSTLIAAVQGAVQGTK
ncbi:MAG: TlpA disulfide reductase family protein [Candidatus Acidiferrales bacterium]